jgi:glycosyltransferase involved in cell wall biosynthesis
LKYLLFPEFFKNRLKMWYYTWIIRRGAQRAEQIIAVSESTKRDLVRLEVPAEKITVIHEALTVTFSGDTVDVELPDAVGDKPFFLFVGDNRPHKNIARIIEAYVRISNKLDEGCPSFVFAGTGFGEVAHRYAKEEQGKNLVFVGSVDDDLLVALYKRAVALVYPSLYEGFGLPILEAMSLGVPVITSNCSSMPEVAGNAALLVDPYNVDQIADAMISLVQNKDVRDPLINSGKSRVRQFSWDAAARKTIELYEISQ